MSTSSLKSRISISADKKKKSRAHQPKLGTLIESAITLNNFRTFPQECHLYNAIIKEAFPGLEARVFYDKSINLLSISLINGNTEEEGFIEIVISQDIEEKDIYINQLYIYENLRGKSGLGSKLLCLGLCLVKHNFPDIKQVYLLANDLNLETDPFIYSLLRASYEKNLPTDDKQIIDYVRSNITKFPLIHWYVKHGFVYGTMTDAEQMSGATNLLWGNIDTILNKCQTVPALRVTALRSRIFPRIRARKLSNLRKTKTS